MHRPMLLLTVMLVQFESFPGTLSDTDSLHTGKKSDLADILEQGWPTLDPGGCQWIKSFSLIGETTLHVLHSLKPGKYKTDFIIKVIG